MTGSVRRVACCLLLCVAFARPGEVRDERWNTPPELIPEQVAKETLDEAASPRFLPFSASFAVSAGQGVAHSVSLSASQDGVSLAQSSAGTVGAVSASGSATSDGTGAPAWTNIRPNYQPPGSGASRPGRPSLTVSERPRWSASTGAPSGPIRLNIDAHDARWDGSRPELQISQWHPYRAPGSGHWRTDSNDNCGGKSNSETGCTRDYSAAPARFAGPVHVRRTGPGTRGRVEIQPQRQTAERIPAGGAGGRFATAFATASAVSGNRAASRDATPVKFPHEARVRSAPVQLVASESADNWRTRYERTDERPVGSILSDVTDTVAELFDFP